jgi:hypothetical protein
MMGDFHILRSHNARVRHINLVQKDVKAPQDDAALADRLPLTPRPTVLPAVLGVTKLPPVYAVSHRWQRASDDPAVYRIAQKALGRIRSPLDQPSKKKIWNVKVLSFNCSPKMTKATQL